MADILLSASREAQLSALINAHPDLAGKAAIRGELTASSTSEQAGAGIHECSAEEFARFTELNDAYKARFGFPFIKAVKGQQPPSDPGGLRGTHPALRRRGVRHCAGRDQQDRPCSACSSLRPAETSMNAEHAPFRHYLDPRRRAPGQLCGRRQRRMVRPRQPHAAGRRTGVEGRRFDDSGKWMDGWETRRKRFEGHDQAVIRLGVPGVLKGVDIDTRFFTGNHRRRLPDGCFCAEGDPDDSTSWSEVLAVGLQGDSHHYHPIDDERPWTHLRLNIYPDAVSPACASMACPTATGATSRRERRSTWPQRNNGGRALACSDQHFDAWATCSTPDVPSTWATAGNRPPPHAGPRLGDRRPGHPGSIEAAVVDTLHFKGNYPESCSIQAAFVEGENEARIEAQSLFWRELLPAQKLEMHQEHRFERHLKRPWPDHPCTPEHLP